MVPDDDLPLPEQAEQVDESPALNSFPEATAPRSAPTGVRFFTWTILSLVAAAVVALIVVMVVTVQG